MSQKKKVLVADDDLSIVEVLDIVLRDNGYDVLTTLQADGITPLLLQKPDMILLDIWMSGANGKDICIKLKSDPDTKHIPVIMFSANRDTKEIAMQAGANGFISKPFDLSELLSLVEQHTGKSE